MDLAISTKKRKEPQPVNLSAPAAPRVESAATQNAKMSEDQSKLSPWQLEVGLELHFLGVIPPVIDLYSQGLCLHVQQVGANRV